MDPTQNPTLFGFDPHPGIVAIEVPLDGEVLLFRRVGGQLVEERSPFRPFVWLADLSYLEGFGGQVESRALEGAGFYRYHVSVGSWKELNELTKHLKKTTGHSSGSDGSSWFHLADAEHQYLMSTGRTLFKGMVWSDIHRLQLDIEVHCEPGFGFPNAERETDRIIVISMSDSRGWSHVISARDSQGTVIEEKSMLKEMVSVIQERDPDVIEGHNLFKFDLPYIEARCKRFKVPLALGRHKKVASSHPSRLQVAERIIDYPKYEIYGRHVVDTFILAQLYDISTRSLESFGLKDIARQLGLAREGRTYIAGEDIARVFEEDASTVLAYALDDVTETRDIAEVLGHSWFVQAQIFPYRFQDVIVRGNATRIDSLFLREYLRRGYAIPSFPPSRFVAGGYTDLLTQGVVRHVLHVDVRSLYPSIMLAWKIQPRGDELGIFSGLLSDLRTFRLEAKARMKAATEAAEMAWWEALQNTFKILINSFYGYLGFNRGHFSDSDAAGKVTETGRDLLKGMVQWLGEHHCTVVEIDTDGIYFTVPAGMSRDEEDQLVNQLAQTLPAGIDLEMDGRYPAMFSYKMKNYVLLEENGRLNVKGSGLRSRSVERFQRAFMAEMFSQLLAGDGPAIGGIYTRMCEDIRQHRWHVRDFTKRETLTDTLEVYRQKVEAKARSSSAPYELALASGRVFKPGDTVSYYVSGRGKSVKVFTHARMAEMWDPAAPDENVEFYLDKLDALYEKFEAFIVQAGGPSLSSLREQVQGELPLKVSSRKKR